MKKRQILRMLSFLAALCIAAGCRGSTTAETTAGAGTQTETSTVSETTTAAESVSAEVEELEVDHVDEDGIVYYKNPTFWTAEKAISELTINGQTFEIPLSIDKLGECFGYSNDGAFYDSKTRTTCLRLLCNDKPLAWVYLDDCDDIEDIERKIYNKIQFDFSATSDDFFENVLISECGLNSSRSDIINALGNPSVATESYLIYTKSDISHINSYKFPGETIVFYLKDDKAILFSITLKELEEN